MHPIRIHFANDVSPLARGLLGEMFANRRDMEIVDGARVTGSRLTSGIDVVISEIADATTDSVWPPALFADSAGNRLAITINGARVMLFDIRPHYPAMSDPSPDALIAAIRNAVRDWQRDDR